MLVPERINERKLSEDNKITNRNPPQLCTDGKFPCRQLHSVADNILKAGKVEPAVDRKLC